MKYTRFFSWGLALAALLGAALSASAAKESSILLKFADNDKQVYWPFSSPRKGIPSSVKDSRQAELAGKVHMFPIKDTDLSLKVYATDYIAPMHPWMGFRIGSKVGSYFELLGQPGKAIVRVRLRAGSEGSYCGEPAIKSLDGRFVTGGGVWSGKKSQGEDHVWTLEGVGPGESVRLITTRNGGVEPQEIEIFYAPVKVKKAKKGSTASIEIAYKSETNEEGDAAFALPTPAFAAAKNGGKVVNLKADKYEVGYWAANGVAKTTAGGGKVITNIVFNPAGKNKEGVEYGSAANAWIKAPAIDGLSLRSIYVESVSLLPSKGRSGSVSVSSALLDENGSGNADQVAETSLAFSKTALLTLASPQPGQAYYLTFKDALNLGLVKIILNYAK